MNVKRVPMLVAKEQAPRGVSPTDGRHDETAALVKRAREGERVAFDSLVRKYQPSVMRLIARYIANPSDVADVCQKTFVKVYRALPTFRGDSALYTWIYSIAVNTAKNYAVGAGRRARRLVQLEADGESHARRLRDVDTPEAIALSEEIGGAVWDAIAALPANLRTALLLRENAGMSYAEIARTIECPVGTVRSRISRARAAIDERLEALLGP